MAAKLQVRLTFEGGEEMKRALKELGVEGQKGFGKIGTAANSMKTAISGIGSAIKTIAKGFTILTGAALATGGAIYAVAKSSAEAADEVGKMAQKVGVNATALQELSYAAGQSGVEVETLQTALIFLNKALARPNVQQIEILKSLGVTLQNAQGRARTLPAVLLDIASAFQRLPDGIQKTNAAAQLFGARSGAELIPLLNSGADGIRALAQEAQSLGIVFSEDAIKQSTIFNDTLDKLFKAIGGVKNLIGQLLIPELTRLAEVATRFVLENRQAILDWVQKGWEVLVQIVKDLVALFQGREADVVNEWLISARDALKQTLDAALAVSGAVIGIVDAFKSLGNAIAAPFRAIGAAGEYLQSIGPKNKLNIPGFAAGGHIRGPGTGTSDSILARLSNGEFVIRRAMVDSLGLPFLNALNAGMVPAFAEGGAVGGRPVNVNIGGERFAMNAADGVVSSLTRWSRQKSLRSPGRSPSWVGR